MTIPAVVERALARAKGRGFNMSCEPIAGALLASLAAAVPRGGRILELGTGAGAGLAWIVHGLGDRTDAKVISVEVDSATRDIAMEEEWPGFVTLELGNGRKRVTELGLFELIFADEPGSKLTNLAGTIAALQPGGILLVDDMDPTQHTDSDLIRALDQVGQTLLGHPDLVGAQIDAGSGLILATRR